MRSNIQCMCASTPKNLVRVSYGGGVIKPAARTGGSCRFGLHPDLSVAARIICTDLLHPLRPNFLYR